MVCTYIRSSPSIHLATASDQTLHRPPTLYASAVEGRPPEWRRHFSRSQWMFGRNQLYTKTLYTVLSPTGTMRSISSMPIAVLHRVCVTVVWNVRQIPLSNIPPWSSTYDSRWQIPLVIQSMRIGMKTGSSCFCTVRPLVILLWRMWLCDLDLWPESCCAAYMWHEQPSN